MTNSKEVIIIGGGAAGFFAAINIAESNPELNVTILEKSSKVLQKVKVSGGGRCNVTHACFDPKELVGFYPRGHKELLGPFHRFMTGDTIEWFEQRGIPLKIEDDLRMFPESNSSQTIIDCFISSAQKAGVKVLYNQNVIRIQKTNDQFLVETKSSGFIADKLLITTGGNANMWDIIKGLGHHIIKPVPSLFTFNIKDPILDDIPGISVPNAMVAIEKGNFESIGPLLITHWGLSGPAVLKLSSLAAIELAELNYHFSVVVNWLNTSFSDALEQLKQYKSHAPKKNILLKSPYEEIPKRLWAKFILSAGLESNLNWSDISNKQLERLSEQLTHTIFKSHGKTTFKEEFVTCGGIKLDEIDMETMESKKAPGVYFAGEVLDVDADTGGYNLQAAFSTGWVAGRAAAGIKELT